RKSGISRVCRSASAGAILAQSCEELGNPCSSVSGGPAPILRTNTSRSQPRTARRTVSPSLHHRSIASARPSLPLIDRDYPRWRPAARLIPAGAYRARLMTPGPFTAELSRGEAVLSFPYDERLRRHLRSIPGRRWDPQARSWCVPIAPEQAASLTLLLDALPATPQVSEELARALRRQRSRRNARHCVVELARPDDDWWLSFATDGAQGAVRALLAHPRARQLP